MRMLFTLLLAIIFPVAAVAQDTGAPSRGGTFAIRAGRIITAAAQGQWAIENGVVLVKDGKIAAVGRDVAIPAGMRVLDLPGMTVMPGLVAAASAPQFSQGPESVRAAYRAADGVDRYEDNRRTLASGVTTQHVSPGWNRLVSGQGAVVRLAGPPEERVLLADADLCVTLGETAFNPPPLVELLVPPSSDQEIKPAKPQRPSSRLGQYLALKEAIEAGTSPAPGAKYDVQLAALADAWRSNLPVRIQTQRAPDLAGAIAWISSTKKPAYLVGGLEAARVAEQIGASGLPLVYTASIPLHAPGRDLGDDPAALDADPRTLAALARVRLAIGVAPDQPVSDLRLAAATALRAGLSPQRIIDGITRVPAEILGVGQRVGSLEPGKDADLLVLSGDPLATSTHVQRVYVMGKLAYSTDMERSAAADAATATAGPLVVRGGTIWLGPNQWLENGSILIEDGKITQVGKGVGTPPAARVIDAGPDSFITPGFIDAFGHLGLAGDTNSTGPDMSLAKIVGVADESALRVARAGVTTVMLAPYRAGGSGSQVSAVKTAGDSREERVVASTAGVYFDVTDADPISIPDRFRPRIEAGKKYSETWKKYEQDLADWEKKKAEGKTVEAPAPKPVEETPEAPQKVDPVTGTWAIRVFGGPTPDERNGKIQLKLTGTRFEGRITEPAIQVAAKIVGELDGKRLTGHIEVETRGFGFPTFEGTIDQDDHCAGTISIPNVLTIQFDMHRVDKGDVEFKVQTSRRRSTVGKDGRPLPPKVDDSLEPFRAVVEKRIPLVVAANNAEQIDAVLDLVVDQYDLPLVLLSSGQTGPHLERMEKKNVAVIAPTGVQQRDRDRVTMPIDELSRKGIRVAFESNAEDGARTLPGVAMFAVERGFSPEAALAALTIDAAKMYKIDDRVGQIAPGRAGDLVIFSGRPFETSTSVRRVIIGGEEVTP
jgi:imidazolonepropionase-like amidohydrolase